MVRQILDLRTTAEREGITRNQQTIQAITDILKTVGKGEQKRRERQTLDRIARVIGEGKTTAEAIAAVAGQGPEFGRGLPGILQKIGGLFQPSPGGIKQSIQQAIIGDALKKALQPQTQIPPGLEPSGVTVSPTGGVTTRYERAARTKIQELEEEGYSPEQAKMIRDISHGLQPRASARAQYESMSEIEKLDFLTKVKLRAEGQYYGIEGGNVQPRDPKLLDWTLRELNKLPQYRQQGAGAFDPEGIGYDDDTAREAGLEPNEEGHQGSLDPRTGMLLKGMKHETIQKTIDVERELGNKIVKRGKRYYSIPTSSKEPVAPLKKPRTGTVEAKTKAAIAEGKWDEALMWMHYGKTPIPRGIATRAQQAGHSAESIVKAIQTFPDPTKITAETLNAALQGKTSKPDPLGIR